MSVKCPECQRDVANPGRFCPFCGGRMPAAAPSEPAIQNEPQVLAVDYAVNRYLMAGVSMAFVLRVRVLDEAVGQVSIWMRETPEEAPRMIPAHLYASLKKGVDVEIPLVRNMPSAGIMYGTFWFVCLRGGDVAVYEKSLRIPILSSEQSSVSIVATITNSDGALIDLEGALNNGAHRGMTAMELIRKSLAEPIHYKRLELRPSSWRPEDAFVRQAVYPCRRLTLEFMGYKLQVVSGDTVSIGRDSDENDLIVRNWRDGDYATARLNQTVSRRHVEIRRGSDGVRLVNLGQYGFRLNHETVMASALLDMPGERPVEMRIGNFRLWARLQRCPRRRAQIECCTCPCGALSALTFQRQDDLPECAMVVWQCCRLDWICRRLQGVVIYRRNGGFFLAIPGKPPVNLTPGDCIPVDSGHALTVTEFWQN